jgi:hypothetical protein
MTFAWRQCSPLHVSCQMKHVRFLASAVVLGSTIASQAAADLPPPDGYTEQCTVATQQQADETCVVCDTYASDTNKCQNRPELSGYTKRCSTRGASVWAEVWCKPGASGQPDADTDGAPAATTDAATPADAAVTPAPTKEDSGGCTVSEAGGWKGASAALVFALGLLLLGKRRRAS